MRKPFKRFKLLRHCCIWQRRRSPHKPDMLERFTQHQERNVDTFEKKCADGAAFVPVKALPPWKRGSPMATTTQKQMNFAGFKVREVERQKIPGFSTHFQ